MLAVYAIGFVVMVSWMAYNEFSSSSPSQHTYIQIPQQLVGLRLAPDRAFSGMEQALERSTPAGQHRAAEYDNADGQPRGYFYADRSTRSATAVSSAQHQLETVLQRELPGGPFDAVAPGGLGGQVACASTTILSQPASECAFADTGATGAVILLSEADATGNVLNVRQAIEVRATRDPTSVTAAAHSSKPSKTGQLVGGLLVAFFALLGVIFGPRFLDFIRANPELQLIPSLVNADMDNTSTKWVMRGGCVVLFIAGTVFFLTAL